MSLNSAIKKYLELERIEPNKAYVRDLVANNKQDELQRLFGKRLTFGTAGIRGRMGPGFGQINDLVIIQTSQGIVSYLLDLKGERSLKEQGVIVGHDARHNSDRFSRLVVLAFLQKGIPVYYCEHNTATPIVAYGVRRFSCSAGIMITASHNPKHDNGYKVYWDNGSQILSPHDKNIQNHIEMERNQTPWPKAWDEGLLKLNSSVELPKEWEDNFSRVDGDLSKSYFGYIEQMVANHRSRNQSSNISITYTTMHGVGHIFLSKALEIAGFVDAFPVEAQKKADPEFSTVKFPNPEESGALDLAFETAKHANSNLILANDPDADRCAAALYEPKSGYRRVLNGNEIGTLLGWWLWHNYNTESSLSLQEDEPSDVEAVNTGSDRKPPADCYMLSTAVSSRFLQSMSSIEGFKFVETLTGFKYMGSIADDLMKKGKKVLFAYEEAIGYMVDPQILDKDGISAAIQVAQCAAYLSSNFSRSLESQLDWLYLKYGYHYSLNSYYLCHDQNKIRKIFQHLQSDYPKVFSDDKYEFQVTRVRDLNSGLDSGTTDHKPRLPVSTSSFMVTFFIHEEITFTIRTSGTEPKIKYYSEIVAKLPGKPNDGSFRLTEHQQATKLVAQDKLRRFVSAAIDRCLKPKRNGLEVAE